MLMLEFPAWGIAILALLDSLFLLWRFRRKRDTMILAAGLTRIALAFAYLQVQRGVLPLEARPMWVRSAIGLVIAVDVLNHIFVRLSKRYHWKPRDSD